VQERAKPKVLTLSQNLCKTSLKGESGGCRSLTGNKRRSCEGKNAPKAIYTIAVAMSGKSYKILNINSCHFKIHELYYCVYKKCTTGELRKT